MDPVTEEVVAPSMQLFACKTRYTILPYKDGGEGRDCIVDPHLPRHPPTRDKDEQGDGGENLTSDDVQRYGPDLVSCFRCLFLGWR